jgi:hypothetical protein
MSAMRDVCVVHLVWVPLGLEPFREFLAAYRRYPGGMDHRLVLLFNGVRHESELQPYLALLRGIPHEVLRTPAPTQDLPAYHFAVQALDCDAVCFLNSYSRPLDADWLAKLHRHASRPGVGLVGATGSWASIHSGTLWRYGWPSPYDGLFDESMRRRFSRREWLYLLRPLRWRLKAPWVLRTSLSGFPPFPAVHVRTNAFMFSRALGASLRWGTIRVKNDAYRLESGNDSLTRQVLARGLKTLLVGVDGEGYDVDAWPESEVFWQGRQRNLLVSDNQTADYESGDAIRRQHLSAFAWRERARPEY